MHADVAILGSGFAGCLTALLLQRTGRSVIVIDKSTHPRFAIGESSTPIADMLLADLANRYDLPRLKPLSRYGSWCSAYPEIARGLKRGFSYFRHDVGQPFQPHADHRNEFLVTASATDAVADTHWYRSDVDAFLAEDVKSSGIPLMESTVLTELCSGRSWRLRGRNADGEFDASADFVIDATGPAGVLSRELSLKSSALGMTTNSRALFSHFRNVRPWEAEFRQLGGVADEHPFPCDAAAVHHVFDDGWMWQLRFDNGITSAGFVFDAEKKPTDETESPESEWSRELARFPSIASQFADAELVEPPGRLIGTPRLQRRVARAAGENWALLPHAAGFVDPLHSTGIAHTLCGVERLVEVFAGGSQDERSERLSNYNRTCQTELTQIDRLVTACYGALPDFRLFTAMSMPYFAAATTFEQRRVTDRRNAGAFLLADDDRFCEIVDRLANTARRLTGGATHSEVSAFEAEVSAAIAPWNSVGLCDPSVRNMYRYTAADKGEA